MKNIKIIKKEKRESVKKCCANCKFKWGCFENPGHSTENNNCIDYFCDDFTLKVKKSLI